MGGNVLPAGGVLQWISIVGALIISWPVVGLLTVAIFHRQVGDLLNRLDRAGVGAVRIAFKRSSNPAIERDVLDNVASYGRQIGLVQEAMVVLFDHFRPERALGAEEQAAIDAFKRIVQEVAAVKTKHPRSAAS
jgi:hypothetical protein